MWKYIKFFNEIKIQDIPTVGGKTASLGEMFRELSPKGVRIPPGFAITAQAYRELIQSSGIQEKIKSLLSNLDLSDLDELSSRGQKVRQLILDTPIPPKIQEEIKQAYDQLHQKSGPQTSVAVRSSATAEDLPDASFAGQQETFLNIKGHQQLMEACQKCFASLFTNRAISYRIQKGFDHLQVALSIAVQIMVRSDKAASGVIFTLDTESGFDKVVFITSSYGLGENIVQGVVGPDEFYVFKPTLKDNYRPIISKELGSKEIKMIYDSRGGTKSVRNIPVSQRERSCFSINEEEVLELARWAMIIEDHYGRPMDIEWAKDGLKDQLYILQARPETVQAVRDKSYLENFVLLEKSKVLVSGNAVGSKIASGQAHLIRDLSQMAKFKKGEILITEMTDPDWVPLMKKASAIVTERGGRTCHAAIVSRELGLPAVVGAQYALDKIKAGQKVTVSCAEGEKAHVYEGELKYKVEKLSIKNLQKPPVSLMMNVAQPDQAFQLSFIPNDGVGLARMEFMISQIIQIHPLALINYPHLKDPKAIKAIQEATQGYDNKKDYFVEKLALSIAPIAAAFYPKPVILRFSDFKTNEYANLIGGKEFEPEEENPMLGFRGASRYYDSAYQEGFALECQAIKKARLEMGLSNLKVMIPFCRTVEEAKKCLAEMEKNGLKRGKDHLEVYMMCEIPANVVLADEFAKLFDGFSIGSNDLTQLTLGLDRDSPQIAHLFDERNEAVKKMIHLAIRASHEAGIKIGICGQAPSDYPEFAEFLIKEGIDSLSLSPDAMVKTLVGLNK